MPKHASIPAVDKRVRNRAPRLVAVFDKAVEIPAAPGVVLIDEVIDLLPHGVIAWSKTVLLQAVIEYRDGNGVWRPCQGSDAGYLDDLPGGMPRQSVVGRGYDVCYSWVTSPLAGPMPNQGDLTNQPEMAFLTNDRDDKGGDPVRWDEDAGMYMLTRPPQDLSYKLRLYAQRSDRIYSPEEQAAIDAQGARRVRIMAHASDLCVWEKEVEIPVQDDVHLWPGEGPTNPGLDLDLNELGLTTGRDYMTIVAEIRRDGRTVGDNDPAAPPVRLYARIQQPGVPWDHDQNGFAGLGDTGPGSKGEPMVRGSVNAVNIAHCTHNIQHLLRVMAWRKGACDPAAAAGCTLRIRVLAAPYWMEEVGPFYDDGGSERSRIRFQGAGDLDVRDDPVNGWGLYLQNDRVATMSHVPAAPAQVVVSTGTGVIQDFELGDTNHRQVTRWEIRPLSWDEGSAFNSNVEVVQPAQPSDYAHVRASVTPGVDYELKIWC